jgi:mono/diheme cytochrome c family protein
MRVFFLLGACCLVAAAPLSAEENAEYIGSVNCEQCHAEQYGQFQKYSKKAHSWQGVSKMLPDLTPQEQADCFTCHTTGYKKPGGFVSYEKTPNLADVGCETCHGPGSLHADSGDTDFIKKKPEVEECSVCHNADRIQNFNFKPLVYSGGHS